MILPNEAAGVLLALAPAFTQPTFRRFTTLLLAAILTPGRRTVANLLRTLGCLAEGHRTGYQRARWPGLRLAVVRAAWCCAGGPSPGPSSRPSTTPSTAVTERKVQQPS